MTKLNMSEHELAQKWGISPKTLQRWRSEGRGPRYLKLSKRVIYPIEEIQKFESRSLYASTSERASDVAVWRDSALEAAEDVSAATGLPINRRSGESKNACAVVQPTCNLAKGSSVQVDSKSAMVVRSVSGFITYVEAARATQFPKYYFTNAAKRAEMNIPHYHVGGLVRYKLDEIIQWERQHLQRCGGALVDPISAIFQNVATKAEGTTGTEAAR
jgi:hypothetical protein